MHNYIFEIREDRDFTAEERVQGTMDETQIHDWHPNLFDYIIPLEHDTDRPRCIQGNLLSLYGGAMTHDGSGTLTFHLDACLNVIDTWTRRIRALAESLSPVLSDFIIKLNDIAYAAKLSEFCDAYVYDPNEGDIMPARKYLAYCTACEDGRKFYVGKIWDYHV